MRVITVITVVALATVVAIPVTAVAAPTAPTAPAPNATNTSDASSRDVIATVGTVEVADVTVDDANGTATATVRATRSTTTVVVTDASPELDGATQLAQARATVDPGETVRLEVPLASPSQPAITVATRRGIVGWGEQSRGLFSGRPGWRDVQGAAVGGVLAGALPGIALAIRRLRRDDDAVEQVI